MAVITDNYSLIYSAFGKYTRLSSLPYLCEEEEAAKMAAYFSNAYITLAASAAKDSTVPLFPTCAPKDEQLHIEGHIAGRPYHVMAHYFTQHPHDGIDSQEIFPLLQRGWVYQEIFLSPRVLHFGGREVVYICRSDAWCQCDFVDESIYLARNQLNETSHPLVGRHHLESWELWNTYVEDVSNLTFTYEKDRLAAMAGLATRFATVYDTGKYLAGLWEKHLIFNMCWMGADLRWQRVGSRPDELGRIPSWSWASRKATAASFLVLEEIGDGGDEYRRVGFLEAPLSPNSKREEEAREF